MTDLEMAGAAAGVCVVCWFFGYGHGAVVRTVRRMMGKAAR